MLINCKMGNVLDRDLSGRTIDRLELEWHETNKRVQRKHTVNGQELMLKFLNEAPELRQGDILFEDESQFIIIDILPCDCMVVKPLSLLETASICYEIGNKHLPLFFDDGLLLVPFEWPLYRVLLAQGYVVQRENRRLMTPLKTTVSPHGNSGSVTLFSKIMQLTNSTK